MGNQNNNKQTLQGSNRRCGRHGARHAPRCLTMDAQIARFRDTIKSFFQDLTRPRTNIVQMPSLSIFLDSRGPLAGVVCARSVRECGGQTGIRTLETVSRLHTFQACAFDHSATCPWRRFSPIRALIARPHGYVCAPGSCGLYIRLPDHEIPH